MVKQNKVVAFQDYRIYDLQFLPHYSLIHHFILSLAQQIAANHCSTLITQTDPTSGSFMPTIPTIAFTKTDKTLSLSGEQSSSRSGRCEPFSLTDLSKCNIAVTVPRPLRQKLIYPSAHLSTVGLSQIPSQLAALVV